MAVKSPEIMTISGVDIPVHTFNTLVVGSGCGAFNAADCLVDFGQEINVAIVTEGMNMGTSRNTGSDKQTYYKLSLSSSTPDSVYNMAKVLYDGQSIHGDTALVEAALSARCFYKLVNLGVPFPHDRYGQYVGYKTDHDPLQRATSCGPLTSNYMTQHLERAVKNKNIPIFDEMRVITLLTSGEGGKKIVGALALDKKNLGKPGNSGLALFRCSNIIYATGGPSAVYYRSVFPQSQTCAHGAAFLAGAKGSNVTEWQYGLASIDFRWNLSGTFQQVIPRYVSTAQDGSDQREFLEDFFETPGEMLSAVFMKGYQWPFDPRKLQKGGSSIVDIAVYRETQVKNRRVFLDFVQNPKSSLKDGQFDFSLLSGEAYAYLKNSRVLFGTPIERLLKMNAPAYNIYKNNDIDLATELLEIAVCSQHNNGGLAADKWWQSNISGLFPVGEACGNFGVYRPGGSALNATQVGGVRAAQYICSRANQASPEDDVSLFSQIAAPAVSAFLAEREALVDVNSEKLPPKTLREKYQKEMDKCAAFIRTPEAIAVQIGRCRDYLSSFTAQTIVRSPEELVDALINRDILITQLVYLKAMKTYIDKGGRSRGSYLIDTGNIDFDNCKTRGVAAELDNGARSEIVQEVFLSTSSLDGVETVDIPRRPLPPDDAWFETVYNDFLSDRIIGL